MIFTEIKVMDTLFWNRFMVIGSMGMPIAFFGYAQDFLIRDRKIWLRLGYLFYLITQISNAMGSVITDAYVQEGRLFNEYGGGIFISSITWAFFVLFLTYDLAQEYRKADDALYRNRIKYLLIVSVITFAGSLTNVTELQVLPVDIAFNAVSAFLIAYAILRHRLLDITFVVRRGLLYSIPTIIIGAGYFLIISLTLNLFQVVSGTSLFVLSLIVAIITALVAQPLRENAQSWIDRLFFREKYDSGKMLQRVSSTATSVLELDILTNMILGEVTSSLQIKRAAIFIKNGDIDEYTLIAQRGLEPSTEIFLNNRHPIVNNLSQGGDLLTEADLNILPQFKALWKQERRDLERLGAELYIPLKAKDKLVGIFAIGSKLSGETYSQDDQLTLTTLANQTAVAIEHARLYDAETKRRREVELLQKTLTELKSDLNLKQVLEKILLLLDEVIPYDSACVYLLKSGNMHAVTVRGFKEQADIVDKYFPVKEDPLFQEICNTLRPLILKDVHNDPRYHGYGGTKKVKSWMGVPLIVHGEVIGCLTLDSYEKSMFTYGLSTLAQDFANQASIAIENARLFQIEHEQHQLAEALRQMSVEMSASLDYNDVLDQLLVQIVRVLPYDSGNIMLVEGERLRVVRTHGYDQFGEEVVEAVKSQTFKITTTPSLRSMVEEKSAIVVPNTATYQGWIERQVPVMSWIGVPIIVHGEVIACFSLDKLEPGFFQPEHAELLAIFAGQAALALHNAHLFNEVKQLAITDELTGIPNRRQLIELGKREFKRAQRFGRQLSIIMMDIDNFKQVNDTYGHVVGDQVLRFSAERCRETIREVDILGRYGGDEFIIFLPETELSDARKITERLCAHMAEIPALTTDGAIDITASFGVACFHPNIKDLNSLIERADVAMFTAKRQGGNGVYIYR
jgi:diguanylate cyclase (GGDEF)-like protein